MSNSEIAKKVLSQLEEEHIKVFHDCDKNFFYKKKNELIDIADTLSDKQFNIEMMKLFALLKDAHTKFTFKDLYEYTIFTNSKEIIAHKKRIYILDEGKYKKVIAVNGVTYDEVVAKLKEISCYEIEEWFYESLLLDWLKTPYVLSALCIGNDERIIQYTLANNKVVEKVAISRAERQAIREKLYNDHTYAYNYKILGDNILYFQYNICKDVEYFSFQEFVKHMQSECPSPIVCVVDLRNNAGGNSNIIKPFVEWVKENKAKVYVLCSGCTFSSGVFAIADLKRHAKATIVGTTPGQPIKAFGNIGRFGVMDKEFLYSTRYYSFTEVGDNNVVDRPAIMPTFNYEGKIKVDIEIQPCLMAKNKGLDNQLETLLEIIKKENTLSF